MRTTRTRCWSTQLPASALVAHAAAMRAVQLVRWMDSAAKDALAWAWLPDDSWNQPSVEAAARYSGERAAEAFHFARLLLELFGDDK